MRSINERFRRRIEASCNKAKIALLSMVIIRFVAFCAYLLVRNGCIVHSPIFQALLSYKKVFVCFYLVVKKYLFYSVLQEIL